MTLEIRPAKAEEMEEYRRLMAASYLPSPDDQPNIEVRPEWSLCAFEDGKLAATYGSWPLVMRFNDAGVPVAGITNVSTLPIHRRKGYLRKITEEHFKIIHDIGEWSIAALWAAHAAIYQRYGYGIVSTRNEYRIEPRYLQFAASEPVRGTYREIEKDESEVVVDIYRRFGAERTGYLERAPVVWDIGLLGVPPKGGLCCTVAYEEAGEALGYVIYTVESKPGEDRTEPNQVVWIRDFAWLTASAYRALWQFFAPMDLVRRVGGMGPDDDPLPHLLMEPRMLNSTKWDGLLGRIVDVEKALPKRGYQEEGTLVFEVLDEICSWNRGRWKLETSSEGAVVRKTSADPEVALPISTLAMLVFGQISATEAWRMGRLDVFDQSALPSWDRVLRTKYRPFCPDVF